MSHTAIAEYLTALNANRVTGATVAETTHYTALQNLLNAIGATLKPSVRCITGLRKRKDVGIPDGGLFAASQFPKGEAISSDSGQIPQPERGVIEAKGISADVRKIAKSDQVRKYWVSYRQVLVTSFREFLLVGDIDDRQTVLESFSFAPTADEFWKLAAKPKSLKPETADQLIEFIKRVMLSKAKIATPEQVAWFLASYARDARSRIEASPDLRALMQIRESFETGLGIAFDRDKGDRFFRSTLVQTLFYGIFSAWTIWQRERGDRPGEFVWETSWRYLRVPVLQSLFHRLGDPETLENLNLIELFDWTANVLNRVNRSEFFAKFEDSMAVQYFYEPFLEAFDPELRKDFGVWYTPPEVVRYMVERVDRVLREELGCADGLASPDVFVLDPCCGTGAYLVAVIEKIAATLAAKAGAMGAMGALGGLTESGQGLKSVVLGRVFGFELLTAPFVIAHLQIALKLDELGDPLVMDGGSRDRAGVFLTNALTGWTASVDEQQLAFMDVFERERDAADKIKQKEPILVVLGNPPYNSFAGMALNEERELSDAYRMPVNPKLKVQGQGLNDLYVRFFRMAERRIVEQSQRGIVCFISNYSWLDGLSFTGMRERYLSAFDRIYIDNLNGDKYATGKVTPDGKPDPSVFSTDWNKEGIQVGTAIALLLKKADSKGNQAEVLYREFWGKSKLVDLLAEVKPSRSRKYEKTKPSLDLGLPFKPKSINTDYFDWPLLKELMSHSYSGVKTARDDGLVNINLDVLKGRIETYFDLNTPDSEIKKEIPTLMTDTARFKAKETRDFLKKRGLIKTNFLRYYYRPFDLRWLYWESETKLLDEKRVDYVPLVNGNNLWIASSQRHRRDFDPVISISEVTSFHVFERGTEIFPLKYNLHQGTMFVDDQEDMLANYKKDAKDYLEVVKKDRESEDLFFHILSINHSQKYQDENGDALKQDWPRIPLPNDREQLKKSAQLGKTIAKLLDPETPVPTITSNTIAKPYNAIAIPSTTHGNNLKPEDLALTANWGNGGNGKPVMPGKGKIINRDYTPEERKIMGETAIALLGNKTNDIYLNDTAYWQNIPDRVWKYTIGGYQVIKKWLSYRAQNVLGRPMKPDEIKHIVETARRISAIILLEPKLDQNYQTIKQNPYPWPK
jgi:hypothetical protein